jgi:hypothetical protein
VDLQVIYVELCCSRQFSFCLEYYFTFFFILLQLLESVTYIGCEFRICYIHWLWILCLKCGTFFYLFLNSTNLINNNSLEIKLYSFFYILSCFLFREQFWGQFKNLLQYLLFMMYWKEIYVVVTVVCICM